MGRVRGGRFKRQPGPGRGSTGRLGLADADLATRGRFGVESTPTALAPVSVGIGAAIFPDALKGASPRDDIGSRRISVGRWSGEMPGSADCPADDEVSRLKRTRGDV